MSQTVPYVSALTFRIASPSDSIVVIPEKLAAQSAFLEKLLVARDIVSKVGKLVGIARYAAKKEAWKDLHVEAAPTAPIFEVLKEVRLCHDQLLVAFASLKAV